MSKQKKEDQCKKCEEYLNGWKRSMADYDNLKKRVEKEKEAFAKFANLNLIVQLIPVYENLKIALRHVPANDEWVKGVKHIKNSFKKILEDNNVSEIIPNVGDQFNPETHEAIAGEEIKDIKEIKGNKISKVVSAGYKLHDKVFVPARVIVK